MTRKLPPRYRACDVCGAEYRYRTNKSKYCSAQCKDKAYRNRDPEKQAAAVRKWKLSQGWTAPEDRWRECNYCGTRYRYKAENSRYCCSGCMSNADYHRNKAQRIEENRAWKRANSWKLVEGQQAYRNKNKARYQEHDRRKSAKRRSLLWSGDPEELTAGQWDEIKHRYFFRCGFCGTQAQELTRDHIVPLSKGGADSVGNVAPACRSCNSKKHDKWILPLPAGMWEYIEAALKGWSEH